jgi:hypothetical protein
MSGIVSTLPDSLEDGIRVTRARETAIESLLEEHGLQLLVCSLLDVLVRRLQSKSRAALELDIAVSVACLGDC